MKKGYAILVVLAGILGFSFVTQRVALEAELEQQAQEIKIEVQALKAFSELDKVRMQNINRVLSIINKYNRSLPSEVKYKIASEINDASMKYDNLDVDLICATITHETGFTWDPKIVSPAGAVGLMQVMPPTGEFLARVEGIPWTNASDVLLDPVLNIRLGSRYLSSLIEMYEIDGGLAAYNGGGKRAKMWLAQNRKKGVLYKETQNYVPAVLALYEKFRMN